MHWMARFPRFSAWLVSLALVAAGTLGSIFGLRALQPDVPAHLGHVHGLIVAVEANGMFAVSLPGRKNRIWFKPAPGSSISLAHLLRHLHEHAPTDIYYQLIQQQGVLLAWVAD